MWELEAVAVVVWEVVAVALKLAVPVPVTLGEAVPVKDAVESDVRDCVPENLVTVAVCDSDEVTLLVGLIVDERDGDGDPTVEDCELVTVELSVRASDSLGVEDVVVETVPVPLIVVEEVKKKVLDKLLVGEQLEVAVLDSESLSDTDTVALTEDDRVDERETVPDSDLVWE